MDNVIEMDLNIKFESLLDKLKERVNGDISKEELYDWLDENIVVANYIPLAKKYAIISVFNDNFAKQSDLSSKDTLYMVYDMLQMFAVLFAYTSIVVLSRYRTVDNYDLVMKSGFFDYMMKYCEDDYEEFIHKFDRVCGIDDVNIMEQFIGAVNNYPTLEEIEKMRDIINNDIDKDKMEVLRAVEEYNNPVLKEVMKSRISVKEIE